MNVNLSELPPLPIILVIAGILFLLLGVAQSIGGKINISPERQKAALVIGIVLLAAGLIFSYANLGGKVDSTQTIIPPTSLIQATLAPTNPIVNTLPQIAPTIYGFELCPSPCNGQNSISTFPGGITKIYAQFNYKNIPFGSQYFRTWSMEGQEWIRYTCNWDGPSTGTENVTLTEPRGLHSGIWQVMVSVDNQVLLQEQFTIGGNWTYWAPAGVVNSCHRAN